MRVDTLSPSRAFLLLTSLFLLVAVMTNIATADETAAPKKKFNFDFGSGGSSAPPGELTVTGKFYLTQDSLQGRLVVEAEISPEWHLYSITQPKGTDGGPMISKIKIPNSVNYRLAGPFVPDQPPHKVASTAFHQEDGQPLIEEQHEGRVVWTAPIELTEGVKPESLEIAASFTGQICHATGGCIPKSPKFVVKFAGYEDLQTTPPALVGEVTERKLDVLEAKGPAAQLATEFKGSQLKVRGTIEPKTVAPGGKVKLTITAEVAGGWHVYMYQPRDPEVIGNLPTLIAVAEPANWNPGKTTPSAPPTAPHGNASLPYYLGTVQWVKEFTVPTSAKPGDTVVNGRVGFQTCTDSSCMPGEGAEFTATINIGTATDSQSVPLQFAVGSYKKTRELAKDANKDEKDDAPVVRAAPMPLPLLIVLSLAGGFLLNLMPCVLPVLGLKLMSFAKQGGESKARLIAINLSYTAGLMVVFMILAVLSITIDLAWGAQNTNFWFRLGILVVSFALSLSLFGVWEIPIPGFAGSESSSKLQQQEGLTGAFFKGLFTTILGISCSGPLLGFVLGTTIGMPPAYTLMVFGFIGLGMASPFLLLPFVPGVRNILPKPGDWMDTFKQLMGFVMLAAAIFFLSTIGNEWKIATLTLLLGVSFACWWIGKVPTYEPVGKQLTAWIGGAAAAALFGVAAFNFLGPPKHVLEWQEFSLANITKAEQEGRTVFVDFTADWCMNCQTNARFSVEREAVKKLMQENNVVAMKADWSEANADLESELKRLKRPSIPLLAVYPAGKPTEVLVLDGLVLPTTVLDTIRRGGPSKVPLEKKPAKETETAKVVTNHSPAPAN
jgi:thiol:disulfide interchange protein